MTDVHCHPQKTRSKFLPEMTTTQALNIDQPKSFLSLYNTGTFFWGGGVYNAHNGCSREREKYMCLECKRKRQQVDG